MNIHLSAVFFDSHIYVLTKMILCSSLMLQPVHKVTLLIYFFLQPKLADNNFISIWGEKSIQGFLFCLFFLILAARDIKKTVKMCFIHIKNKNAGMYFVYVN